MKFAVRTAEKDSRNSVTCSKVTNGIYYPKDIAGAAFIDTLYRMFSWNVDLKYRISGSLYHKGNESVYIFNTNDAEVFIKPYMLAAKNNMKDHEMVIEPLSVSGKRVRCCAGRVDKLIWQPILFASAYLSFD